MRTDFTDNTDKKGSEANVLTLSMFNLWNLCATHKPCHSCVGACAKTFCHSCGGGCAKTFCHTCGGGCAKTLVIPAEAGIQPIYKVCKNGR
jgi:hypothetical protein